MNIKGRGSMPLNLDAHKLFTDNLVAEAAIEYNKGKSKDDPTRLTDKYIAKLKTNLKIPEDIGEDAYKDKIVTFIVNKLKGVPATDKGSAIAGLYKPSTNPLNKGKYTISETEIIENINKGIKDKVGDLQKKQLEQPKSTPPIARNDATSFREESFQTNGAADTPPAKGHAEETRMTFSPTNDTILAARAAARDAQAFVAPGSNSRERLFTESALPQRTEGGRAK
jgi:hypothetical protein